MGLPASMARRPLQQYTDAPTQVPQRQQPTIPANGGAQAIVGKLPIRIISGLFK